MKLKAIVAAALLTAVGAQADTIVKDNGATINVPAGYKAVIVPEGTPSTLIAVEGVKLLESAPEAPAPNPPQSGLTLGPGDVDIDFYRDCRAKEGTLVRTPSGMACKLPPQDDNGLWGGYKWRLSKDVEEVAGYKWRLSEDVKDEGYGDIRGTKLLEVAGYKWRLSNIA